MSVYKRYFKIQCSDLIGNIEANLNHRNQYFSKLRKIGKKYGATNIYAADEVFTGFEFKNPDRGIFRQDKRGNGWLPKKNCAEGKAIIKAIDELGTKPVDVDSLLADHIPTWKFSIVEIPKLYRCGIFGSINAGWFVSVPWKDVDPVKIEAYRAQPKKSDSTMDHLCWLPPENWLEVKLWEVEKALDEARALTP